MTVNAEEINCVRHIVSRLRILLGKRHVIEALLRDPQYRVKLYLVAGLLREDFLLALSSSSLSRAVYRVSSSPLPPRTPLYEPLEASLSGL